MGHDDILHASSYRELFVRSQPIQAKLAKETGNPLINQDHVRDAVYYEAPASRQSGALAGLALNPAWRASPSPLEDL